MTVRLPAVGQFEVTRVTSFVGEGDIYVGSNISDCCVPPQDHSTISSPDIGARHPCTARHSLGPLQVGI